jgi:hypothetical protein
VHLLHLRPVGYTEWHDGGLEIKVIFPDLDKSYLATSCTYKLNLEV